MGGRGLRHLSALLKRDLRTDAQAMVRVAQKVMAAQFRAALKRGKSDAIDGLAVARTTYLEPDLTLQSHKDAAPR